MTDLYADSSALAKLIIDEEESQALAAFVAEADRPLTSSALVRVELTRAVRSRNPAGAEELQNVFDDLTVVPVDDRVLAQASRLVGQELRTLDAIHLATAVLIDADEMLVYDRRLAEAAARAGIRPLAPGT